MASGNTALRRSLTGVFLFLSASSRSFLTHVLFSNGLQFCYGKYDHPVGSVRNMSGHTVNVVHRPRLLSDNGPCYLSGELAEWLDDNGMTHTRGAPYHPQTQGKIERRHQTLKNRILLENYFLPGDLKAQVAAFIGHYNHQRYHESLRNVTPADAYYGRSDMIISQREKTKRRTVKLRRLQHEKAAA